MQQRSPDLLPPLHALSLSSSRSTASSPPFSPTSPTFAGGNGHQSPRNFGGLHQQQQQQQQYQNVSLGQSKYDGVFAPVGVTGGSAGWGQATRGQRSGLPNSWLDSSSIPAISHSRDSPVNSHYGAQSLHHAYHRETSPPALSSTSSTSGPTTSNSSNGFGFSHSYALPIDPSGFSGMGTPMAYGANSAAHALSGYQDAMSAGGAMPSLGSHSLAGLSNQRTNYGGQLDEEIIPTAIVIKNIPFAIGRETLLNVIESLGAPLPYAFNYHHDNGVFRGLAFANFRAPSEADAVVAALNGYDVSGRKLRVEYKKVLQAGEKERIERDKAIKRMRSMQFDKDVSLGTGAVTATRWNGPQGAEYHYQPGSPDEETEKESQPQAQPQVQHSTSQSNGSASPPDDKLPTSLDLNDPVALDIYSRVLVFKEDRMRDELAFSRSLQARERRIVHLVAQKLDLWHCSVGDGDERYVVVTRGEGKGLNRKTSRTTLNPSASSYLSPYSAAPGQLSPGLRIKKSMPDLRGFHGPVVSRDPARSLTPQRSSGNLRDYATISGGTAASLLLRNPRGPAADNRGFVRPSVSRGISTPTHQDGFDEEEEESVVTREELELHR